MNQSYRQAPFAILLLLLIIGAGAIVLAFWLFDHRLAMLGTWNMIAMLFGVFFVSYTWALFKYLRWRDRRRSAIIRTAEPPRPDLNGTVYGMISGREYRVMKSFTDYYGNSFQRNELLRFKERHFLPYDGGHTIIFDERSLYLQEDRNQEILENFSEYIAQVT